jgi:hypothetical protein
MQHAPGFEVNDLGMCIEPGLVIERDFVRLAQHDSLKCGLW